MMDQKRSPITVQPGSCTLTTKRHKSDIPMSPRDKKEKFGERIAALQQLVSPYGKTDTASVLLEAMEYIGFLQKQVKVLSAPFLHNTTIASQGSEQHNLRSKGLCVVPISWTVGVVSSNGADIWAPIKTDSSNF